MGRPRKAAAEQRTRNLTIRFTAAERDFLDNHAEVAGVTVGELIRRRALRLPAAPPKVRGKRSANAALVNELNRIGVNLNQLAHAANRGITERSHWAKLADELSAVLERLVLADGS